MIQLTLSVMARATRQQPSTTKKAIFFLRPVSCMVSYGDCTARSGGARDAVSRAEEQIRFGARSCGEVERRADKLAKAETQNRATGFRSGRAEPADLQTALQLGGNHFDCRA